MTNELSSPRASTRASTPASTPRVLARVVILGGGLIGSSIGRGLTAISEASAEAPAEVLAPVFIDRSPDVCRYLADKPWCAAALSPDAPELPELVARADLILLCISVRDMGAALRPLVPYLRPPCLVTDVGSSKAALAREIRELLPDTIDWIPGHPVAGTENSGPEHGSATLFRDRFCILTPLPGTPETQKRALKLFWEQLGMQVEFMDPAHHDRVLAMTSHVPHVLAYTITGTAFHLEAQLRRDGAEIVETQEVLRYAAGGFRDFTRVASSDPALWRDIVMSNRPAILEMLGRFYEDLFGLQRAIRFGDEAYLLDWFERAKKIRKALLDQKQVSDQAQPDPQEP